MVVSGDDCFGDEVEPLARPIALKNIFK